MIQRDQAAAELLWAHWTAGTRLEALPADLRPTTRLHGYRIQALLETRSDHPLYGWKIAATSPAGQAHIGVDGPLAGRILGERVVPDAGTCPYGANHLQAAEIEFAFRMGATLPPREQSYHVDEVFAAVATLHPAIEIPDSRYEQCEQAGAPQLIADNACANYFVEGFPAPEGWRTSDLAHHAVTGWVNDTPYLGIGANVMGDPRSALVWLVNELSHLGIPLVTGQIVTTGTCVLPMTIAPGDHIRGDFGMLGTVTAVMDDT